MSREAMMSDSLINRRAAVGLLAVVALLLLWSGVAEGKLKFQSLEIPDGEMELIDLDGDSLKDIVVYTFASVLVFWHHPEEGFKEQPDFSIRKPWANEFTEDFTLADLDGDTLVDIFLVREGGVCIHLQKPGRQFSDVPDQVLSFAADTWLVDLGEVSSSNGLEVVTVGKNGVMAWQMNAEKQYGDPVTISTDSMYLEKIDTRIYTRQWPCPWNFCLDANGDKKDDLLLPQFEGVLLCLQEEAGKFMAPLLLKTPVVCEFSTGVMRKGTMHPLTDTRSPSLWTGLQAPSVSVRDVNGDGRPDVVLDEVFAYVQNPDGTFPQRSSHTDRERISEEQTPIYDETADEFCDVNGDGVTDRVYQYRPWSTGAMKSVVHVYFGDRHPDLLAIDPENLPPDTKKVGGNFLLEAPLVDLNGDGALDIVMLDTNYKITQVADWIEINRGNIDGEIQVTYFDKETGKYPPRPHYRRKVSISYAIRTYEIFEGKIFDYVRTMVSVDHDLTGNGRNDLLIRAESRDNEDTLIIYENTGNRSELFAPRPTVVLKTPTFHSFRLMDVNSDGVNDFVLYNSNGRRVGILMSYYTQGL